ncbi:sensor histidine kinase [Heyndrickxia acidicola]|uniref:histidine kinase n=1 Tax=Heyndrickxia acidicola TaxID=209389 RepID=A0ABU6MHX1_9BACI|nr:HAMP domain-containing sensor histidine kinase [Heyndrickxia acidicola]MED1203248.1 HAMP domain-containing sensor histidine kinase [Heyndrickxia acidicola]
MRAVELFKRAAETLVMVVLFLLCWTAAFYLTAWVERLLHLNGVSPFVGQMITSLVGLFIFSLVMLGSSRIESIRDRRFRFFNPIVVAMEKMAQGDFNIDLSTYKAMLESPHHPFSKIVQSVDHMASELGEMERMRQEFISNVSHEIQSPLTSISGFARALESEDLSVEERKHYLDIIQTESKRLSKLSENLLKLTTLESDHPPFEMTRYSLDQQLRNVMISCEPQWSSKNLQMDIDLNKVTIEADKDLLSQVWINLLHNSIKFTPDNGSIRVQLTENDRGVVYVKIKDSGAGMSQDVQMHIFERFYKADPSRNRSSQGSGSGLGLAIVKKIVELHHGRIHVLSRPGEGTEMTVVLPKTASWNEKEE